MGLENTRFHPYAERKQAGGVLFVDLFRFLGRGGAVECGPAAAPDVAVKSKLRDDQRGPATFEQRDVHFPGRIVENAQVGGLVSQIVRCLGGIALADAQQDHESRSNLAHDATVDGHLGAADALDHCAHVRHPADSEKNLNTAIASLNGLGAGAIERMGIEAVVGNADKKSCFAPQ